MLDCVVCGLLDGVNWWIKASNRRIPPAVYGGFLPKPPAAIGRGRIPKLGPLQAGMAIHTTRSSAGRYG